MSANAQLYDDLDILYRELWGTALHHGLWITGKESPQQARDQLTELCLNALAPEHDETIADIGCGYGSFSHRLVENAACQVHAFSNSSAQIHAATPHPEIYFHHINWLDHTLPDDALDKAIALECLSHFPDFDAFFSVTTPSLKKCSTLVISDWYSAPRSSFVEKLILRFLAHAGAIPPWRPFHQLLASANNHSLKLTIHRNLSARVSLTWTAFFKSACLLPFRKPKLIPLLIRTALRRPQLLISFPLLRLAYHTGLLEYHLCRFLRTPTASPSIHAPPAT